MIDKTILRALIGALLAALAVSPALAAPAVSGVNGKVEGIYGNVDSSETKAGAASLSVPLCNAAGAQLDGAFGEIGDDQVKGVGLHLFTRDPAAYLLGLVGSYAELESIALERYALEGEAYVGPVTLVAILGHQSGDVDDSAFGSLDLRWYPVENLMVVAGGSFADSDQAKAHIGAEYQLVAGLSAFADFASGESDYDHALFGAKYYFGAEKSLQRRHREDDPSNTVLGGLIQGLAGGSKPATAPGPTTNPGGGIGADD